MRQLFLYISTERNNHSLEREVRVAIDAIKEANTIKKHSRSSYIIKSVSVAQNVEKTDNDCRIIECLHDWEEKENAEIQDLLCANSEEEFEEDEFRSNDFLKIAEYLHSYADICCKIGDVINILWCVQNYAPCASEVVEFYGALKRLLSWHNGCLNIVTKNLEAVSGWSTFLALQIIDSSYEVIKSGLSTLWKGSLGFSVQGKNAPTFYSKVILTSENEDFNPFEVPGAKGDLNAAYVLPVAEVFSDVDLGSIPWPYIQRGSLCKLMPAPCIHKSQYEDILQILNNFAAKQGTGSLIRIRYASKYPHLEGLSSENMNTESWKQMIADGKFDLTPTFSFKGHHHCLVLLVLPENTKSDAVFCISLQDPNACGEDIVKLVMQEALLPMPEADWNMAIVRNLLKDTRELSAIQMAAFSHLLVSLPPMIKKQMKKLNGVEQDLDDATKYQIECATSEEVLRHLLLFHNDPVPIYSPDLIIQPEISVRKELWPEYRALEQQEKDSKKPLHRTTSGEYLCGLPPPICADKVITIDAAQLAKFFTSSGEPLDAHQKPNSEYALAKKGGLIKSNLHVAALKDIGWPDAIHVMHHGIYYNSTQEHEKLELRCNLLRERHIRHETDSTCTLFQGKDNAFVKVYHKKTKNTVKKTPDENRKTIVAKSSKPSSEMDSCSVRSGASISFKRKRQTPTKTKGMPEILLRRSPRKRKREDDDKSEIKPSDLLTLKPPEGLSKRSVVHRPERRNPKPADLSEVHKQKLRNVILSTLEAEGIKMKDNIFKLCFKKLFAVCKPFALDIVGQGSTTKNFEKIAKSHVKQVVHFEKTKNKRN